MTEAPLKISSHDDVDWICLNRPEVSNALNGLLTDSLYNYFNELRNNKSVRVVVLHAEGRNFCAGLDLKAKDFDVSERTVSEVWSVQRRIGDIYRAMRRCPQPIISLIQGAAVGGGFSLALASDIRIAADSSRMSAAYMKIGLTGADMGSSYFLPRLVGVSIASELLLTGRFINARRALECGLVSEIVGEEDLELAAQKICSELLQSTRMGLNLTKEALNFGIDAPSLEAAMAQEDRHQVMLSMTEDALEAISAFNEKRSPKHKDK